MFASVTQCVAQCLTEGTTTTMTATKTRGNGEGSVYRTMERRKAGPVERWAAQLVIDGAKQRTFHTTEAQAKAGLRKMQREIEDLSLTKAANMTVSDLLTRWDRRSLSGRKVNGRPLAPATMESYRWCIDRLTDELGSRRVRNLDVDQIEAAFDRLAEGDANHRPCSRWSLIKCRSVLGQALDWAVKRKMLPRNVAEHVELPNDARAPSTRKALTVEEAKRLLDVIKGDRLEAMYLIMLSVGLRPGEAAGLTWADVDLDAGTIAVRYGVRIENRRAVLADALKTARSRRTITLPQRAADALRAHRKLHTAERLKASWWADDRLVFCTTRGTVLEPRNVARSLAAFTKQAGLDTFTPNELRHSAASLLSASGVPLERIADLLGHTSTRMLEQTYRHSVQPSIDAAVGAMDSLLA